MSSKEKATDKFIKEAHKKKFIQKFKGKFKDIKGGGTILFTNTIQSITDPTCLAVYVYLASKPPEWEVNVKELMRHFKKLGRNKAYQVLNDLCMIGVIHRKEVRESGKFSDYEYYLYLEPITGFREPVPPITGLRDTAKRDTVNRYTYKEEIPQKEKKEKKLSPVDKSTPTPNPTPANNKHKKPTVFDRQQFAHGIDGFGWVGEYLLTS